ncbi:molybdopterin molybdenumtransferase MoeA [Actinopolyspora erythraea]|uniref:Molybdopterin molybdenumtransferase n=1 Tax=Actinopolyspora erythraea TaxID=414996 RepID=A0A099D386_9ACTN|nr:gephyrin-like molybdotransferase Glp [Actinopolyspora erythraea]ASU77519.1 molybdopterin molybdenumtransferase MoeA [Actinopolyspora erythraea]KGI80484.1 molybdopterin molybdenumtransferase [Actinopolyspora erythraea]
MRSVDEQLARVLAAAVRPSPVRVAIAEAQGLLCAEEVVAERALPGADQAAVDGYAVRGVDVRHADSEPVELPVVGEVAAGSRQPRRLQPGQTVYVATGAPLPTLSDAVVPASDTDQHPAKVTIWRSVPSAAFVRREGADVRSGDVAVRRGTAIGPAQVGLLAAIGRSKVLVHPRPRVSLISLGPELVDVDRTPGAGQIYDVNSYALAAAARDAGADVTRVGIVDSDPRRLREVVEGRLLLSEVVVIAGASGGSAGAEVRSCLEELGDLDTTRVAMHPGSTQGFGRLGPDRVPTFLLPANPVSALVVFEVLVRPLLRSALGKANPHRRAISAELVSPVSSTKGRRGFVRGRLLRDSEGGSYLVQPVGGSGEHLLASLAEANCLMVLDEDVTQAVAGERLQVSFLSQRS